MAAFIQIIEWSSSRIDEVRALGEARRAEMEVQDGPARITITADRGTPGRYMTLVEFGSYEAAMRNSSAAEPMTRAWSSSARPVRVGTMALPTRSNSVTRQGALLPPTSSSRRATFSPRRRMRPLSATSPDSASG